MKRLLCVLLLLFVPLLGIAAAKEKEEVKPAQSLDELRQQIQKVLTDTKTPGVSVAIVHRDGIEWLGGVGKADVARNVDVTPETLFRIGSTSKAFASLSILKLANEGKLSLDDPIKKYVPELWFENKWESTDPVRIVNLLEHTTGWDDMSFRQYAKNAPEMPLGEALAWDGKNRISRWRPGTRFAYCNTGPAVAALIVEKVTGQKFEDYVQQNFFDPIGMKTATYFYPQSAPMTTLYHTDGKTPYQYWNVIYRPAGSINASARDMAAYLQFYLNRGNVNGVTVMPAASIDRMESPVSTWAAKEGLKAGYGLSNYWTVKDGFVYHGHNGGVEGGLTNMAYLPEYGVGYSYSINSGSSDAFDRIGKIIRAYVTRGLQRPAVPAAAQLAANDSAYAGWYIPDSPRNEMLHFLERLLGLARVEFEGGKLVFKPILGSTSTYVPVTATEFREVPASDSKEAPDPIATLALLPPKQEGTFFEVGGTAARRIPSWMAILQLVLTALVCVSIISVLIYAPFWILGGLSKKRRRPAERCMRLLPLLAVFCLIAVVAIFIVSMDEIIERMGILTIWSGGIWLSTVGFALASLGSAFSIWRAPKQEVRAGYWSTQPWSRWHYLLPLRIWRIGELSVSAPGPDPQIVKS